MFMHLFISLMSDMVNMTGSIGWGLSDPLLVLSVWRISPRWMKLGDGSMVGMQIECHLPSRNSELEMGLGWHGVQGSLLLSRMRLSKSPNIEESDKRSCS